MLRSPYKKLQRKKRDFRAKTRAPCKHCEHAFMGEQKPILNDDFQKFFKPRNLSVPAKASRKITSPMAGSAPLHACSMHHWTT
mmetsp:Transcript_8126/g.11512  ORF Transcript_8126/g.11512 Transcript_8126/m.11512 type:complete len:83 (+) Transcript_8126:2081-2329(+)